MPIAGSNIPRADVGGGGLAGALSVLFMLALNPASFNFQATEAAIAVALTFAAPYVVRRFKSFVAVVAAPVATLLTSVLAYALFAQPLDSTLVSTALSTVVVALVTYLGRPVAPDVAPPLRP